MRIFEKDIYYFQLSQFFQNYANCFVCSARKTSISSQSRLGHVP
jgi:hypothetical protein